MTFSVSLLERFSACPIRFASPATRTRCARAFGRRASRPSRAFSTASWWPRTSRRGGGASGSSVHSPCGRTSGIAIFDEWQTVHRGLFTFSHSPKHHALYQKFGFYPRFLTALLRGPISSSTPDAPRRYSTLSEGERLRWLERQRDVAGSLFPGLDLAGEIGATQANGLGDTVFVEDGDRLAGFAVCHVGAGTEAGSGTCYVKFAAVRGEGSTRDFARLLDACEALGVACGATRLVAGVNLAREQAYRALLARGMRVDFVGVAMQSGNEPAFNRPDVLALDDWR